MRTKSNFVAPQWSEKGWLISETDKQLNAALRSSIRALLNNSVVDSNVDFISCIFLCKPSSKNLVNDVYKRLITCSDGRVVNDVDSFLISDSFKDLLNVNFIVYFTDGRERLLNLVPLEKCKDNFERLYSIYNFLKNDFN